VTATGRAGPIALVIAGLAGLAWFGLFLSAPSMGFEDTDDPALGVEFLRLHGERYYLEALALFVVAGGLLTGAWSVRARLAAAAGELSLQVTTSIGLFAAACLFLFGILRAAANPILHINELDPAYGRGAYLAMQIAGVHGVLQAGLVALALWIGMVAWLGARGRLVPVVLAAIAIVPAFRLVALTVGPFVELPDGLWIFNLLSAPVAMLWPGLLGLVLLRRRCPGDGAAPTRRTAAA
jgi:hypothetical protein